MKRLYILAGANGSGINGGNDLLLVAHGNGATNVVVQSRYDIFMEDICRN